MVPYCRSLNILIPNTVKDGQSQCGHTKYDLITFFFNYYQRLGPISEMYTQPSNVMSYLNIDPWDIFLFI